MSPDPHYREAEKLPKTGPHQHKAGAHLSKQRPLGRWTAIQSGWFAARAHIVKPWGDNDA